MLGCHETQMSTFFFQVDGQWGDWTEWTTCSTSCDGGSRRRTRMCNDPLPACDGLPCNGTNTETEDCNVDLSCKLRQMLLYVVIYYMYYQPVIMDV